MSVRLRAALPYAVIALFGAALAYFSLFSQFAPHDDSGHLSVSLTEFIAGRNLYEDLYSQYGPLYFELFGGLFSLPSIKLTTDSVRMLTMVLWIGCGLLVGVSAARFTTDRRIGWLAAIAAFAGLTTFAPEPMHPVGVTTTLTCLIMAILAFGAEKPPVKLAVGLGALVGALAMIKVNMGALAAVALIAAALIALAPARRRAVYGAGAAALIGAATLVLLSHDFHTGWVQKLIALQLAGSLAIVVRAVLLPHPDEDPDGPWRWIGRFAAGGLAVVVVVSLLIFILGTTPAGLVDGVLIDPTRHPEIDVLAFTFHSGLILGALIALAFAIGITGARDRLGDSPAMVLVRSGARIAAAVAILASIVQQSEVYIAPSSRTVTIGVLAAWLVAVAPRGITESQPKAFARLALALVAVLEVLQAYPVAGSQLKAASLLFVIVAAVLLADGLTVLTTMPKKVGISRYVAPAAIGVIAAYVAIGGVLVPLKHAHSNWKANTPLDLYGAHLLRIPQQQADSYRTLVAGVKRAGCDPVVSMPGQYSLQGWFRQRPPTGNNVASWMLLLSLKRQRAVVAKISDKPHLCVLRTDNRYFDYLAASRPPLITKPLYRYLTTTPLKTVVQTTDGKDLVYRLQVRPDVAQELNAR